MDLNPSNFYTTKSSADQKYSQFQLAFARRMAQQNPNEFHNCCKTGDTDKITFFLAAKVPVDTPSDKNRTPLQTAVFFDQPAVVDLLIKSGANINVVNEHGQRPLYTAIAFNKSKIINLLLEAGAIMGENVNGALTVFHAAASSTLEVDIKLLKLLMSKSFFPACWQPKKLDTSTSLKELSLSTLLRDIDLFDEGDTHTCIIPVLALYESWTDTIIVEEAPIPFQRDLLKYYKQKEEESKEYAARTEAIIVLHCQRQLLCIQTLLELKNKAGFTAQDICKLRQKSQLLNFLNTISKAKKFTDLPEDLRRAIVQTIKDRLAVNKQ